MIIPVWRDFPGRLVRLAVAALLISTAMTMPRVTVADSAPVAPEHSAPATAVSSR